ncbi:SH3 domain-containing protein 19 isoform X3 [Boleophthalmus pectinirostris]|uniref:SH3 domain-containing protein 19 isoform X3 n=1 Tax=Boleophthalmus pectinirostris TaxID=150288 RepID=UPI00242F1FE6|nr:SH3 domain-containing protein 19 isoform X3 [Boleophthalmus pectinirostris]
MLSEEENEMRRNTGDTRNTGPSNRLRTDHTQARQGPLSSIKAVIKRTKPSSQSEHRRGNHRRRPEITILSAEPLDCSGVSPGNPLVFSAPHTPPPQVPRQKTQEVPVKPVAPPRHLTCKTTTTAAATAATETAGKKPLKPPRPSAPKNKTSSTATDGPTNVNLTFSSSHSNPDSGCNATGQTNYTRSVTVHWNNTSSTETSSDTTTAFTATTTTTATTTSSSIQYPVPLPRIKSKRLLILPAEPQTLVELSENSDPSNCIADRASSNKYLEELLEVFKEENLANFNQSSAETEYVDEMSAANSLRARIQAFENQAEEASLPIKPQPVARKTRPPVAAKPSVKPQFSADDIYENVSSSPPTPAPKSAKKPLGKTNSVKEELDAVLAQHRSKPPKLTREDCIYDDDFAKGPSTPPVKPTKEPLRPNLNINNHNNYTAQPLYDSTDNVAATTVSSDEPFSEYEYMDRQSIASESAYEFEDTYTFEDDTSQTPETTNSHYEYVEYSRNNDTAVKPKPQMDNYAGSRQSMTRRPTTIIVPRKSGSFSDGFQDSPPALPVQKPVGALKAPPVNRHSITSFPSQVSQSPAPEPTLPPRRLTTSKTLPPRPPMVRSGSGRPPAPRMEAAGRSLSSPWDAPPKPQKPQKRDPLLPPRPNPGHCLYNKYTLHVPHGVASTDYDGRRTGELSFQKNEVLVLLNPIDSSTYECQVGDRRGRVHRSCMKVITPVSASDLSETQGGMQTASGNGLTVEALFDFNPENPDELDLRAGDVVTMVEQVDSEWYKGTCRGSTGFFPINYAKILENSPRLPERNGRKPSSNVSGPRCVARFDFEGEHSDELSFSEGDVIQLKSYVGQDWARGQLGDFSGIFPLNFVEIIQDLPPAPSPQPTKPNKIALPGMVKTTQNQVTPPAQSPRSGSEWVVALYDFSGNTEGDLSFQAGDRIFVTHHLDEEWSNGRLNGKEGIFPWAFVSNSREDLAD